MATLGDKSYNYSFYGLPDTTRVWGTAGVGGYAALTYLNLWGDWYGPPISEFATDGVYWSHDGQTSNNNGKPLDTTISLWYVAKNSSFANNGMFSHDISNTLSAHFDSLPVTNDVPLAACAVACDSTRFGRRLTDRYAYDSSSACNGAYSAPVFDIVLNNFCLRGFVIPFNRTTGAIMSGINLSSVKTTIDNSNDDIDICVIRPSVYRAATTPRFNSREYIPSQGLHTTEQGVILFDTLSDHIIPDNQTYLQSLINNDKVYAPFYYQYAQMMYNGTGTNAYDAQMDIGFSRPLTVSQLKSGAYTIDSGHNITAQLYRCNTETKVFDDVAYKWDYICFDVTHRVDLQNGFPLDSLQNSDSIRFYTKLSIVDDKGVTRGEALTRAIKHELAYIGLYFADDATKAANTELGVSATGVYLPLFNGGVTTGEYVTGDDIPLQPHANASSVADDTFKYRPEMTDSDSGDLQTHLHSGTIAGGVTWCAGNDVTIDLLTNWLNKTYKPDDAELAEDFKGVNPADYIISIRYYPAGVPTTADTKPFTIGGLLVEYNSISTSVGILDTEYGINSKSYYDLGSFTLQPPYIYGDFRDTYIKLLLYIPWCGFVTLDPSVFCQSPDGTYHTIKAGLSIDYRTGAAHGMIYRDNVLIDTIEGTAGVEIPMTAVAQGSYQNAIKQTEIALQNAKAQKLSSLLSVGGAIAGTVASVATGNVLGAVLSGGAALSSMTKAATADNNVDGIKYQLTHTAPAVGDISSASPFNNALSEQAARIFIFRPVMLQGTDLQAYGKTTGFACCKAAALSKFSGFTVCADVDLSGFNAPAHHKLLIKQALQKGVYL